MNKAIEQEVRRRAAERCEYCHLPQSLTRLKFSIDHVQSKQHGGSNEPENLALACGYCNRHKGPNVAGIDSETGKITRLFHPRSDSWTEHSRWRGAAIVGFTPVGRATVAVLNINSRYQLSIRQALIDEGAFVLP